MNCVSRSGSRERARRGVRRAVAAGVRRAVAAGVLAMAAGGATWGAGNSASDAAPPQGFAVPKADSKTIDKLDDLDRYVAKKAWELAFRTVSTVEKEGKGMTSGEGENKDFLIPVGLRVKESLLHLPTDGRDAYRLFNDAKAKQLWEKAAGSKAGPVTTEEMTALRAVVNDYFLTSVGDLAADRLGDAEFEQGNFAAAEGTWRSVVEEYPDSHLPAAKMQVKRCVALLRMGNRGEAARLAETIKAQYSGQQVTIGGNEVDAGAFTQSLLAATPEMQPTTMAAGAGDADGPVTLANADDPLWQIRVATRDALDRMEATISNWGGVDIHFTGSTPSTAMDGGRLYVNWLGVTYAADLQTGKMLWRSGKFSDVVSQAQMFPQYGLNPDHFAISAAGGKVFSLNGDTQNWRGSDSSAYQLECFDGATGKSLWKAAGLGAVLSAPTIVGDRGYVLHVSADQEMTLTAFRLESGKSDWSVALGKPQTATSNYNGNRLYAVPAVLAGESMMYVGTNNGALLAVNLPERRVEWAFRNDTKPIATERYYYGATPRSIETGCTVLAQDGMLYLKDTAASRLYALDPAIPQLKWKRTVSMEDMVIAVRGNVAYLLGKELSALDVVSRKLLWSTKLPVDTGMLGAVVEAGHIYVPTRRGIYDIDPTNGDTQHIYRGADRDNPGGRLLVAGDKLICVTDAAVTAYPVERGLARGHD